MSEVKERPMLFCTPMVQATLNGRKTMTRCVWKLPKDHTWSDFEQGLVTFDGNGCQHGIDELICPHGYFRQLRWPRQKPDPVCFLEWIKDK